jgi:protein-tyrosine phosphatase
VNQIHPHNLWIGHTRARQEFRALFDAGIQAVVDLALEEPPTELPRELLYCRIPLLDGSGNRSDRLLFTIHTIATLLRSHVSVLVVCSMGMSRAPALSAAALALLDGESPVQHLEQIARHHAHDISPSLWQEVVAALTATTANPCSGIR